MAWPPAVRAVHLNHAFANGETPTQVLFDINFEISAGEIVLMMGPSGCGKTTLLTLAGALRQVQEGSLQTLGVELRGADEETMIAVRRKLGFIYQSDNLHHSLTAMENVRMALEVHGPEGMTDWKDRCAAILSDVGLWNWRDAYPATLSGGQKQRVSIARSLVAEPRLILADEPTAALDKTTGRQVVSLLQDMARKSGSAVLMVTHDNRILDLGDRILEMEDGRLTNATLRESRDEARSQQSAL